MSKKHPTYAEQDLRAQYRWWLSPTDFGRAEDTLFTFCAIHPQDSSKVIYFKSSKEFKDLDLCVGDFNGSWLIKYQCELPLHSAFIDAVGLSMVKMPWLLAALESWREDAILSFIILTKYYGYSTTELIQWEEKPSVEIRCVSDMLELAHLEITEDSWEPVKACYEKYVDFEKMAHDLAKVWRIETIGGESIAFCLFDDLPED